MIHQYTSIHPEAKIAENVTIGPFTTIESDVEIGEGTWIGSNVTIMEGARIGKNCKIFPGAVVSGIPQDLKFAGEKTFTKIGDNTTIRECVTISRGTTDRNETVIGSNCLLMAYVHIAHDCILGDHCIMANSVQMAGHVVIEDWAIIGGASAIHQFVKIGAHAMVSGGSLVRKDVPPFVQAARDPLSFSGINAVGLRRRGFQMEEINQIQDAYRYLFQKGYNNADAISKIKDDFKSSKNIDHIVHFVESSNRGIIKGYDR
ncbi:MAG: acyl-ACP--UDP-N-acetylglucosamine O-acyltransferase [Cyclobacteriaceae bacterium]|nr:acyl-ACP--UDP-N-acetylglucosamine O-acyltransferase [Cyclobacteriaceae bacterium]MCH8515365.1 acyl-ACP--UDP-N-acetylglucosamine O-acyltransferase [Cyclobacteriaceae bacterium]